MDPYDGSSEDSDESRPLAAVLSRRPRQHGGGACGHFLCQSRRFVAVQPPVPAPVQVTNREAGAPTTTTTIHPALQHLADVQMDSDGSSSELWTYGPDTPRSSSVSDRSGCRDPVGEVWSGHDGPERGEDWLEDSGLHSATRSPTPPPGGSSERPLDPSSYGCCYEVAAAKRKMMGTVELGQRKKLCVVSMKEDPPEGDCTADMC